MSRALVPLGPRRLDAKLFSEVNLVRRAQLRHLGVTLFLQKLAHRQQQVGVRYVSLWAPGVVVVRVEFAHHGVCARAARSPGPHVCRELKRRDVADVARRLVVLAAAAHTSTLNKPRRKSAKRPASRVKRTLGRMHIRLVRGAGSEKPDHNDLAVYWPAAFHLLLPRKGHADDDMLDS